MDNIPTRRKILRGSLAAPLVLTVASPSALAATSFTHCIEKATQQPPPSDAFIATANADSWYRTPVDTYKLVLKGSQNPTGRFYKDLNGNWYNIAKCADLPILQLDVANTQQKETRYALVYVDQNGNVSGTGCVKNGGVAVPTTCWNSFKPATK